MLKKLNQKIEELKILLRSIPSFVLALFVLAVISMNLLANKSINLPVDWLALDCGIIFSWLAFLTMDIMTKHFGPKVATQISILVAAINLFFCFLFFISSKIPCVIFSTMTKPSQDMIDMAIKYNVPTFVTERTTSSLMAEIIRWLNVQLAPMISIHGVLVDVFGEGVLIMGESGIGKSEAALELIKRGHRLVSDDVVEISRVSDITLVGTAPDITRHFIELRGIGIIDVKTLFGVESVKDTQSIDLVIKLEEWDKEKEYDRLGLEEEYIEFLGNKVVCHSLPIRPGRNLAIIVETAAVNHRQKKMGYNAAETLAANHDYAIDEGVL